MLPDQYYYYNYPCASPPFVRVTKALSHIMGHLSRSKNSPGLKHQTISGAGAANSRSGGKRHGILVSVASVLIMDRIAIQYWPFLCLPLRALRVVDRGNQGEWVTFNAWYEIPVAILPALRAAAPAPRCRIRISTCANRKGTLCAINMSTSV